MIRQRSQRQPSSFVLPSLLLLLLLVCCSCSARSQTTDGVLHDDRLPLVQRYWPDNVNFFLHNRRAHPPHFHFVDPRPAEQVNALPTHLDGQPRPRPSRPHELWWIEPHTTLVIISAHEVHQQQQQQQHDGREDRLMAMHTVVPCQEPFLLVLPNLTRTTTHRERGECPPKDVELSWPERYEPELQPPLWWLTHPLSELHHKAAGLHLIRSFTLPRYYSNRSEWYVPVLSAANVSNAAIWQLRSDECGSSIVLQLTSNTNATVTVNLTTAERPSRALNYSRPEVAEEWSALNQITYSPHSYTFMLPAAYLLNHSSSALRHFYWRLPTLVPITLYLPTSTVGGSDYPSWSRRHCRNPASDIDSSQAAATGGVHDGITALHYLHQHTPNSRCPVGEDMTLWPREPAMKWDVWHFLGVHAGHERVELMLRYEVSCDATQPADVVLDIEFFDRDVEDVPELPSPVTEWFCGSI